MQYNYHRQITHAIYIHISDNLGGPTSALYRYNVISISVRYSTDEGSGRGLVVRVLDSGL